MITSALTENTEPGNLQKSTLLKDVNSGNCDPLKIMADFLLWPNKDRRTEEANVFNN